MALHKVVPRPGRSWIYCAEAHNAFDSYIRQRGAPSHLISVSLQLDHNYVVKDLGELSRNTYLHVMLPLVKHSHRFVIGYMGVVHVMWGLLLVNTKGVVYDQGMIGTCMCKGS